MIKTDMAQSRENDTMTVTELIAALQTIPDPDTTPVISEGCDCTGNVVEVALEKGGLSGQYAYLQRDS